MYALASPSAAFAVNATTGAIVLQAGIPTPVSVVLSVIASDSRAQCNQFVDGQFLRRNGSCVSELATVTVGIGFKVVLMEQLDMLNLSIVPPTI